METPTTGHICPTCGQIMTVAASDMTRSVTETASIDDPAARAREAQNMLQAFEGIARRHGFLPKSLT